MIKNFDWKLSSKVFLLLGLCIGCHHSFSYAQQSSALKNVEVKIDCKIKASPANVIQHCKSGRYGDYVYLHEFKDSSNAPALSGGGSCYINPGHYYREAVFKHTLSDGSVMYSESSDPYHFVGRNTCAEYKGSFNPMDVLEALPEIGISRVDPNLIEY